VNKTLRTARLATFGYFALNGFLLSLWVVHIPAIEHRVGVSHALLGWLLLLLGAGSFVGMQVVGPLTDRFGARRVVPVSALLCSAALVLPGLATDGWTLGTALFVLGLANGCLDVSMNTHAVQVERGYGRPVMSAFHAMWSVGGVLASLLGAATLSFGWAPAVTLSSAGVVGVVLTAAPASRLLAPEPRAAEGGEVKVRRKTPAVIWAMAALALLLMLSEGVAADWSSLAARDVLDASAAVAALAYGCFATAMTTGRLLVDRVAGRFGPIAVVRYGAALAAIGLATVALTPWIGLAFAGWVIFGLGLSGCVPQLFSAAGHADPAASGSNVSKVAGLGYVGMLGGPAVIGGLTNYIPLNLAFLLPVAFCVVAAVAAPILRTRSKATEVEPILIGHGGS
jgi:MFS family permease